MRLWSRSTRPRDENAWVHRLLCLGVRRSNVRSRHRRCSALKAVRCILLSREASISSLDVPASPGDTGPDTRYVLHHPGLRGSILPIRALYIHPLDQTLNANSFAFLCSLGTIYLSSVFLPRVTRITFWKALSTLSFFQIAFIPLPCPLQS